MPDVKTAKERMGEAADLLVNAQALVEKYAKFAAEAKSVQLLIDPLPPKTDTIVGKQREEIDTAMEKAKEHAGKHEHPQALALLAEIRTKCAAAKTLKADELKYTTRLGEVKLKVDPLVTAADPKIATEVTALNLKFTEAQTQATNKKYTEALESLEKTAVLCKAAEIKAKVAGNTKPTKAEMEDLMKLPGGTKMLDDVINGLPAKSVNQEVLAAALETRFKVSLTQYVAKVETPVLTDKTKPNKSVQKIYELLSRVPDSQGKDNEKLANIIHYKSNDGGADYGSGDVSLYCGRAGKGKDGKLKSIDYNNQTKPGSAKFKQYFPDNDDGTCGVDENCQQANDDEMPYFDWATLHEVGHAVDDKAGFMRRKASGAEFGGWTDYAGDVTPVAKAAAKKFNFDAEDYIARYLTDESPNPIPALPGGTDPRDQNAWDQDRAKVEAWCNAIRVSQNLWWNGAQSKLRAIDGKVYQECYAGRWVSYNLDARKQGIHGYQFRAPGEWFAEIYAAYYCEKLKPEHPACSWLAKLERPDQV